MSVAARIVTRARRIVESGLPIGPRMDPCVCKAGRHAHSGAKRTGGVKATGCRKYRADLAWQLAYDALDAQALRLGQSLREADRRDREAHYALNPRKPGEWSIGASDTSTCPKKIEYRNRPPEDFVPASEDSREALMGTIIHEGATARLQRLYPWRVFNLRVTIPGLDRQSELDWYDPIVLELGDVKTAGDWKWDALGDDGPDEETWEQVMLYAYALEAIGMKVETIRLDYIKRANGHDETFRQAYDPALAKRALDRLLGYATNLDLGIELPKIGTGPSTDWRCKRCFARLHCWNVTAAEDAGRSPESYTILGAEPLDETVVWAIEERVRTAAEKREAEAEYKRTGVLLDGIEPGRYGEYEGYETGGGNGPDWQEYATRLQEVYELPEEQRPPLEEVPPPRDRKYRYVKWGRVRKATLERERKERAALESDTGGATGS